MIYLWIVIALIVIIIITYIVALFFYFIAIRANDKSKIIAKESLNGLESDFKDREWMDENEKEITEDSVVHGVKLVAYELKQPEQTKKWAVVVHGYGLDAHFMAPYVKGFYDSGYNVLAPDLLGSGKSGGKFISMGGLDAVDLAKWTRELEDKYGKDIEICLFGTSMGATTVLNSLNRGLAPSVKMFIADSGYLNLNKQLKYNLKKLYHLPSFPIINACSRITKKLAGYSFKDVNVTRALKATNLRGLILHGDSDSFVPVSNALEAKKILGDKADLVIYQGSRHIEARINETEKYWDDIDNFIEGRKSMVEEEKTE